MSVRTETPSANGRAGIPGLQHQRTPKPSPLERRRQLPLVLAGVLLVVGCALAFAVASLHTAKGQEVLAVTRPVPAGHVIEPGDLQVVKLPPTGGLEPVLASRESSTVGHQAVVPLLPGTLLTSGDLGAPPAGTAGNDVVAAALKAGAYPPSLGAGDAVDVVGVTGGSSSGTTAVAGRSTSVRAVVVAVDPAPAGSNADAVVSLQVAPSEAAEVATLAAAGQVALVGLPPGSGS